MNTTGNPVMTTSPARRTAGARTATLLTATVAALAVWVVAHSVLGIDLKAQSGDVGLYSVATTVPVVSVIAWFVLAGLERRSANPRKAWTITACVVLVLSLLGPVGGEGTSAKLALACLHLVVALVLIPGYARTVSGSREAA